MDTLDLYGPFNSILEIKDDDHCKLGKSHDFIIKMNSYPMLILTDIYLYINRAELSQNLILNKHTWQ